MFKVYSFDKVFTVIEAWTAADGQEWVYGVTPCGLRFQDRRSMLVWL